MRWIAKSGVVDDGADRLSPMDPYPASSPAAAVMPLIVTDEDRPPYLALDSRTEGFSRFLLPGFIALLVLSAVLGTMLAPPLL
jgi:hypothetical protein